MKALLLIAALGAGDTPSKTTAHCVKIQDQSITDTTLELGLQTRFDVEVVDSKECSGFKASVGDRFEGIICQSGTEPSPLGFFLTSEGATGFWICGTETTLPEKPSCFRYGIGIMKLQDAVPSKILTVTSMETCR